MTGIFVVARLGSTRLSQKHLIRAGDKTFIEWLIKRFVLAFSREIENNKLRIFIVTSDKEENKKFEQLFLQHHEIKVFYGSDGNIPLRQLQCAEAYHISEIINIDGDDILSSTEAARVIMDQLLTGAEFVKTAGLPLGMNVMGYQKGVLEKSLRGYDTATLETGWGRIFDNSSTVTIPLGNYDSDKTLRLTLDYEEDKIFFVKVIEELGEQIFSLDDKSLIEFIKANKFNEINHQVNDTYWANFEIQKKAES